MDRLVETPPAVYACVARLVLARGTILGTDFDTGGSSRLSAAAAESRQIGPLNGRQRGVWQIWTSSIDHLTQAPIGPERCSLMEVPLYRVEPYMYISEFGGSLCAECQLGNRFASLARTYARSTRGDLLGEAAWAQNIHSPPLLSLVLNACR